MSLLQAEEYFVFSIDPVASVADLDDEEATAAAQKLKPGRYTGLVMDVRQTISFPQSKIANTGSQWAGGPPIVGLDYAVDVLLVSHGLPQVPATFLRPEMSYPIAPNAVTHPLGREPITCDPPLPWTNCFHPTWARTVLRFPYDIKDPRTKGDYVLSPGAQVIDLEDAGGEDREWSLEIQEDECKLDPSPSEHDSKNSFIFKSFLPDEDFLNKQPLVHFSLDLSSLSSADIGDPCLFFAECEALER